ncbi:MAG: hypothetical protein QXP70_05190 [Methanomassiliicoccales archaeon]
MKRLRIILITFFIALLLLLSPFLFLRPHALPSSVRERDNVLPPSFRDIINGSFAGSVFNSSLFSPFYYNSTGSFVHGRYVSFEFIMDAVGPYSLELYNFSINDSANNSVQLYHYFFVESLQPQYFSFNLAGSIFYAYSDDMLLMVHDMPGALIQVYSGINGTEVSALFSDGVAPSTQLSVSPGPVTLGLPPRYAVSLMYNSSSLEGYMVSEGSNFTVTKTTSGNYSISKILDTNSIITSFTIPQGTSNYASVLSTISEGIKYNTISYLAEIGWDMKEKSAFMDASLFSRYMTLTSLDVNEGVLAMHFNTYTSAPTLVAFIVNTEMFPYGPNITVWVNGAKIHRVAPLPSILENPFGNTSSYNITQQGNYYIIAVYSSSSLYSLQAVQSKPLPAPVIDYITPLIIASAIIAVAVAVLYVNKRRQS